MGILRILQRRKIRKAFQDHLGPDVVARLLSETGSEIRPPEVQHFQFVVALAEDTNPQEVPAVINEVIGTLIEHRATVLDVSSSLVVALLGVPFPEGNSPEARRELVGALLRVNGERIRIAHGACDGPVGMFGGPKRWTYGAVIPGFSGILKKLIETNLGIAVEVS
ncbi:MAG TPA: hypothetical protein VK525_18465 [Candidatus Saccharimonadales bacterium]|nr:hypothetical protein [Candidatus Saccharimonadales bacterium]